MRLLRPVAVLGTAAIALLLAVGVAPRARAAGSLTVVDDVVVDGSAGRLHDVTVDSPALATTARVRILLPPGYDGTDERYPLLLLLHGASGSSKDWTTKTDLVSLDSAKGLIVVMPDGGATGFYSDWEDGPQWETFHIRELLPWVASTYRTIDDREHTAIVGNSMGGFGAMVYAARHPELFAAATSFSGFLDNSDGGIVQEQVFNSLGYGSDKLWGPYATDEVTWRDHNPTDLDGNLRWTKLVARCGDGVPALGDNPATSALEEGVFLLNNEFHLRLTADGVAHEYLVHTPGTHAWSYWQADLHQWLPTLLATFAAPPARPVAFDYRSAEGAFSAWDWSFTVEREVKAPIQLTAVGPDGLTADGRGTLHVRTASGYDPGATYLVTGPDGSRAALATDDGRLAFPIALTGTPGRWTIRFDHAAPPTVAGTELAGSAGAGAAGAVATLPATGRDLGAAGAVAGAVIGLALIGRLIGRGLRA